MQYYKMNTKLNKPIIDFGYNLSIDHGLKMGRPLVLQFTDSYYCAISPMPRKSRIDAPGALHHIIVRGIDQSEIFNDNVDRNNFIDRLGRIIQETKTRCFAWSLIPNHFHLLLKTGQVPIATVMRRLLTGYAVSYNRRHHRHGHLFQNRYKSILCQEDAYLLELVRYIHLNPIRANIVKDITALDKYPYTGHTVIMGKVKNDWQDIEWVLKLYDDSLWVARRKYRAFIQKGVSQGRHTDLTGGGLIRSHGGWAAVKEQIEKKHGLLAKGYDLDKIALKVSAQMQLKPSEIWAQGKERKRVNARSLLCYWAVRDLGISMAELSRHLKLSLSGVSLSVKRGEKMAKDNGYKLVDL